MSQGKVLLSGVGWPSGGQLFGQTFVSVLNPERYMMALDGGPCDGGWGRGLNFPEGLHDCMKRA